MPEKLKPYQQYKESGEPWLVNIPSTWDLLKTKYLFKGRVQKGYPDEPLLAATQTKGVVPKTLYENRTVVAQKDLHLLKLVMPGDFVISLRSFQGGIEKAYYKGIISPAYTIMIPSDRIFDGYFKYLAKSKPFIKLLTLCVTGIREGQNIDYSVLRNSKLPVPTIEDQQKISHYLDWKTSQINRFIKSKKRLIELLKEQKQVIINDAVTGKIDVRTGKPFLKYKDSGVEWLGQVPEGWEVFNIKQITKFVKTGSTPKNVSEKHFSENGYNWFTPGDFVDHNFITNADRKLSEEGKNEITVFPPGSIYMIGIGATIGKTSICLEEASCNQQINVLLVNERVRNQYLVYVLLALKEYIVKCGKYTTLPILNQDDTKQLRIPIPCISNQETISEFIERRFLNIENCILEIRKGIDLLIEFRNRLISDVVTGKVDVRNMVVPETSLITEAEEINVSATEPIEENIDEDT